MNTLRYCAPALLLASAITSPCLADDTRIYGYFAWRTEKVFDELSMDNNGDTVKEDAPREITVPSFNIMLQSRVDDKTKVFANLNGADGEELTVRNIWGEYKINPYLNIRVGKTYRRFGLYNEILDAVPTYIGIEAPELFDGDHLIVSRETLAMIHGRRAIGEGDLRYSFSVDNGEGGPKDDQTPIGYDLRYEWDLGNYIVGISGYESGGETTSDVELGQGSPSSGVLPWMSGDDFSVMGLYGQFQIDALLLQSAYWRASHNATRDPESVVTLFNSTYINPAQTERFLLNPNAAATVDNVNTNGDYDITTWYVRAGYSFIRGNNEYVPYFQWDYYENPETIQSKTWGGDNEAGLADDGQFSKATLGIIYRPSSNLSVKFDSSTHYQEYNGKSESYPEIRLDISYIFGQ